jgi:hypothetical protein
LPAGVIDTSADLLPAGCCHRSMQPETSGCRLWRSKSADKMTRILPRMPEPECGTFVAVACGQLQHFHYCVPKYLSISELEIGKKYRPESASCVPGGPGHRLGAAGAGGHNQAHSSRRVVQRSVARRPFIYPRNIPEIH